MSESRKYTPKELIKELISGSEYSLKDSVKGRVRVVGRENKIINFVPKQFGVDSLNDYLSLDDEQLERIRVNFLAILREHSAKFADNTNGDENTNAQNSTQENEQHSIKSEILSSDTQNSVSDVAQNEIEREKFRKKSPLKEIAASKKPLPLAPPRVKLRFAGPNSQSYALVTVAKKRVKIPYRIRISLLRKSASDESAGILARVKIPLLMENFGLNDVMSSQENYQMAKKMIRTIANLYVAKDLRGVRIDAPVCISMGFKSKISDVSNHAYIFKLIEDTLVKNRVITDDNADVVKEIKMYKQDEFDGVVVDILQYDD